MLTFFGKSGKKVPFWIFTIGCPNKWIFLLTGKSKFFCNCIQFRLITQNYRLVITISRHRKFRDSKYFCKILMSVSTLGIHIHVHVFIRVHVRVPCSFSFLSLFLSSYSCSCSLLRVCLIMQHGHAARTLSMDMQYRYGHVAWKRTCSIGKGMDMHHGHGHTAWTWRYSVYGHGHVAWKRHAA